MRHRVTVPILIFCALLSGCAKKAPATADNKFARAAQTVDTGVNILAQALVVEAVLHAAGDVPEPQHAAIVKAGATATAAGQSASATLRAAGSETEATAKVHDFISGVENVAAAVGVSNAKLARVSAFVTAAHLVLDAVVPLL